MTETFVVLGIHEYDHWPRLAGVLKDADTMVRLLEALGFDRRESHLTTAASVQTVRDALDRWRKERVSRSVIYWAGHANAKAGGRFFLFLKESPADEWDWNSALALRADELAEYVAESAVSEVLIILDVCYAGGAATNVLSTLWKTLDERGPLNQKVWVLASARGFEETVDEGGLVQLIDNLLRRGRPTSTSLWTEHDEFVRVDDLARALEGELTRQHAELKGSNPLSRTFFRNLGYRPQSPGVTVADADRLWAALDRDDAESHFWPRSRGVELDETGSYFCGREQILRDLVMWMESGTGLRVVTGLPGSGKSALLGRLATLADAAYRGIAEDDGLLEGAGPGTLPAVGAVTLAMRLTGKTAEDCVRRVAQAHAIELPLDQRPSVADLRSELDRRGRGAATLVLDGLDEATEPLRVAEVIRHLAVTQRVLVGTRRNFGRASDLDSNDVGPLLRVLGARPDQVVDLARDRDVGAAIAEYARRRLTDPRSDSPYRWEAPAAVLDAAEAISQQANGVFRLAHDWCRLLCSEPEALTPRSAHFQTLLRDGSAGVFRTELARFGDAEPKARDLLTALALSQGLGLSRRLWPVVATAIGGLEKGSSLAYSQSDALWALDRAGHLVIEAGEHGQTVYRPYHQEFGDYLSRVLVDAD